MIDIEILALFDTNIPDSTKNLLFPAWVVDMGSVSETRRYIVTSSLIGWAHTQNDSCTPSLKLIFLSLNNFQNDPQKERKHNTSNNLEQYGKMHLNALNVKLRTNSFHLW